MEVNNQVLDLTGAGNNRSEGNGRVTSPVDLRAQNLDGDDKENNENSGLGG